MGSPFSTRRFDSPSLEANHLNLYSLPFVQALESIALVLFPPNRPAAAECIISPLDARVDRYILFRAAWQPEEFGKPLHASLRSFFHAIQAIHAGVPFPSLSPLQQEGLIERLQNGEIPDDSWPDGPSQQDVFNTIYNAISEGFFADPGYGGNLDGLGWVYSNFMEPAA